MDSPCAAPLADHEAEAAWDRLLATYDTDSEDDEAALAAALVSPPGLATVILPVTDTQVPQLPLTVFQNLTTNVGIQPNSTHIFGPILDKVVELLPQEAASAATDPAIRKVSKAFLRQTKKLHVSKEALGQMLQMDPLVVEPALSLLTSTLLHCDRLRRRCLEEEAVHSGCELLCYLDLNKFDETPMKLHLKHAVALPTSQAASQPADRGRSEWAEGPESCDAPSKSVTMKATAKGKLFAVENKFAMLLKVPELLSPTGTCQHLAIMGSSLTWLQVLERTTGSLTRKALQACCGVSPSAHAFQIKARVSTSDAAQSNDIAEKAMASDLGAGWSHLHFHCNAHKIAGSAQPHFPADAGAPFWCSELCLGTQRRQRHACLQTEFG